MGGGGGSNAEGWGYTNGWGSFNTRVTCDMDFYKIATWDMAIS